MDSSFRFGTVGAPISRPKKPGGSVGAIFHLHHLGLKAFEIGWVRSVRVSPKTCAAIRTAATENDIALSIHAPYYINLNANDTEWPKARQRLMDAAHYGYLAGATDIIFHPGSYFGQAPNQVLPLAIERLNQCVSELRAANNPVILRPETMGKASLLGSLEDTLTLSAAIAGVEPCLDFAHLHARTGTGVMNTLAEWDEMLAKYAKTLGTAALQRLHIHLSGIEYGPNGERQHLPIQESDLNLDAIFQVLAAHHCGGRIVCESPILEEDALWMQQKWTTFQKPTGGTQP